MSYIFHNDNLIVSGESIIDIDFKMLILNKIYNDLSREMSFIQPLRTVIDINIANHSAGIRK